MGISITGFLMMDVGKSPAAPRLGIDHEFIRLQITQEGYLPSPDRMTINNRGGGVLTGKIIPQQAWIGIKPDEFRLLAGESSSHQIIIKSIPSYATNPKKAVIPNLFVIQSNVGATTTGAEIIFPSPNTRKFNIYPYLILGGFLLFVIFVSISFVLASQLRTRYAQRIATLNVAMLHTYAVLTIEAQNTPTASATPLPRVSAMITPTQSLLAKNIAQSPTITYTPFIIDQNHNPEGFIKDYFAAISQGNTNLSWQMLSLNYQKKCCGQEGKDPYQVYLNKWKDVEKVLVVSAYLLEYNANPALIQVNTQIVNKDGITIDQSEVYWLIYDDILDSFLIDNIE